MSDPKMDKADFISSIILTLFGIGVMVESYRMPRLENLDVNPYTVPGIVPGFIGFFLTLTGFAILIRSIRRGGYKLSFSGTRFGSWITSPMVRRTVVTLVITLVYAVVLFPHVPFWLATPIFIFVFIVATESMKYGRLPSLVQIATALILAVVGGLLINYVFQELFFVRLPGG